jgi:hypothetical protein
MRYIVLSALLLAGCAGMTPQEVRTNGTPMAQEAIGRDPEAVARCIQSKAENQSDLVHADVRRQGPERTEVLVRANDGGQWVRAGAMAVFDVVPASYNKDRLFIRGWINPEEPNDHKRVFYGFVAGC